LLPKLDRRLFLCGNFEYLLKMHWMLIMFCDQDDVWVPQKIESVMTIMLKEEGLYVGCVSLFLSLIVSLWEISL
jgi:hypothetical protein